MKSLVYYNECAKNSQAIKRTISYFFLKKKQNTCPKNSLISTFFNILIYFVAQLPFLYTLPLPPIVFNIYLGNWFITTLLLNTWQFNKVDPSAWSKRLKLFQFNFFFYFATLRYSPHFAEDQISKNYGQPFVSDVVVIFLRF